MWMDGAERLVNLPQQKRTVSFYRGAMIVCALLHDSALLSGFVLNLSPRSARYAILSPGSGQGRPAVGVGAVRCSCAC